MLHLFFVDKPYLSSSDISTGGQARTKHPVTVVTSDGVYLLDIHITSSEPLLPNASYIAYVNIEIKSDYGYLSAASEYNAASCSGRKE